MNLPLTQLVNRDGFGEWLNANGLVGTGVEVGVFRGDYSRHLLKTWAGVHLVGVDPYIRYPESVYKDGCNVEDMEEMRDAVIAEFGAEKRYRLVLKPSLEAVEQFANESLDFVYLDSNHSYESGSADLAAWWPKVRVEGIMGGHDLYGRHDRYQEADIFRAVWEFCIMRGIRPPRIHATNCTSFWIVK